MLEGNSLFEKLSKNKFSLVLILFVFISSPFAVYYLSSEFGPVYFVEATELDEKPERFFPFSNLDSYGIHSVFDSGSGIKINFEVFSDISEMQTNYETKNVEYANDYYELHLVCGDRFPPIPIPLFFFSFIISGILIIGLFAHKFKSYSIKN